MSTSIPPGYRVRDLRISPGYVVLGFFSLFALACEIKDLSTDRFPSQRAHIWSVPLSSSALLDLKEREVAARGRDQWATQGVSRRSSQDDDGDWQVLERGYAAEDRPSNYFESVLDRCLGLDLEGQELDSATDRLRLGCPGFPGYVCFLLQSFPPPWDDPELILRPLGTRSVHIRSTGAIDSITLKTATFDENARGVTIGSLFELELDEALDPEVLAAYPSWFPRKKRRVPSGPFESNPNPPRRPLGRTSPIARLKFSF